MSKDKVSEIAQLIEKNWIPVTLVQFVSRGKGTKEQRDRGFGMVSYSLCPSTPWPRKLTGEAS